MSRLPTYLRTIRKRYGLTQDEIGFLLGYTDTAIARYEALSRPPPLKVVIGAALILGETARGLFPGIYNEIEDDIMRRAKDLYDSLDKRGDPKSDEKLRFLLEMIQRIGTDPLSP